MVPPAQRLEEGIASELGHEVAGEATDRAERRGARSGGARAPLVIIAVTDDADPVAFLERIVKQPLERAPGRMHFHRTFEPSVVGERDIGIASADVRDDDGILAIECPEQLVGGEHGFARGLATDQNVR